MSGAVSCEPLLMVEGDPVMTLLRTVSIGVDGIVLLSVETSSRSLAVEKLDMEERPQWEAGGPTSLGCVGEEDQEGRASRGTPTEP